MTNFEFFIAKRLIKKKDKTYSRPIIKIATISITLSIAVMLISISVLSGFKDQIKDKIVGFGSHIQIVPYKVSNTYEDNPVILSSIEMNNVKKTNNVKRVTPVLSKSAAIITKDDFQGVILKGINKDYDTTFFHDNLVQGRNIKVNKDSKQEALVSKTIANKLHLQLGSKFKVYFYIENSYRMKNFTVVGIYDTGLGDYDDKFIVCDMKPLQEIFSLDSNSYNSYEVTLNDFSKIKQTADEIYYLVGQDKSVETITEMEPNLFSWLNLLDSNVIMIIIIMMLVNIVTLSSVILIMIFEKKTMIGVMKSFGTKNKSIIKIFLYKAGYVIMKGMIYGNILALVLEVIQKEFKVISLDKESYYLTSVPIEINVSYILLIDVFSFIICLICLLIPAKTITKISPVKNLRFD
jgi:lipoprotein-releasing system permease protein